MNVERRGEQFVTRGMEFLQTASQDLDPDLLKVENGRITDNLHIEDNQTLLQKIDVARVSS